ncbi:MAG: response regulator [Provencibacterium sp.]|jgi:signal transduction histidine kinase/CheY-like chemotaxis protein/HPt (histidine-containing phosphotransfer) domain-containing protein|nr:response regulator [Provencibacterium sp.]
MREQEQTSRYLLFAGIATVFSVIMVLITAVMSWELWMIFLIIAGTVGLWCLHIGKPGAGKIFENLYAGLILLEFFFFGIHKVSLFEIPAMTCMTIFVIFILGRKRLLYMTAALYMLQILYHFFALHTISYAMSPQELFHLGIGAAVVMGSTEIARRRINRRELELQRYKGLLTQLETSEQKNAVFLSNVSHEFRTPINMVIGISEVMLEKELSPEMRENIHSVQLAGKRLSHQISNILDYTEIVEGTLTPSKEKYVITSVLNDVITMTAMQGGKDQLEIVFDIAPNMPASLIGDAEKISHVLKILIENSIKFTEEGGIYVSLRYRKESYGINLLIDIYDTGIGMTDSQLVQMQDDFYQADSGSRRFAGGLGLGIPIAQGLLYAMGGFVHFESEQQQGLQVHISIPQGVANDMPVMSLSAPEKVCIACYFRPEKYSCDEVRRYYDLLILHMVEGFGVEGYQAHNFEGLLKLLRRHAITHVFITQDEYQKNRSYYEDLALKLRVVVIAQRDFMLSQKSRLLVIRKPFSALSVVNLLNEETKANGFKEAQAVGEKPFSCVGVRVLAVDDEEMNLVVAKGVLGSYGIQVDTCLSGREAIKRCGTTRYDIVFLDHMMPGFDGVETLRQIREMDNGIYHDLPVIALTANTISGAREMFRNEGFTEFLPKPIERAVLERVLHKVLPPHCIQYNQRPTIEDCPKEDEEADASAGIEERIPVPAGMPEKEEAENETSPLYALLAQAGIHVEKGLEYCSGEDDFYLEMLQMFRSQYPEKKAEIVSLYESANWTDYAIKVHALKSTSLTIGAEQLSEQAKALELAGKRGDTEYIHNNHPALLRLYQEICESIPES